MITPELVSYVKGELAKGKTREVITSALVAGGGWKEEDISEAFRSAIPMQAPAPVATPSPAPAPASVFKPAPAVSPAPTPAMTTPPIGIITLKVEKPAEKFTYTPPATQNPSLNAFSFAQSSMSSPKATFAPPVATPKSSHPLKFFMIFIIIIGLGFGGWYYRPALMNLINSLLHKTPVVAPAPIAPQLPPAPVVTEVVPPPVVVAPVVNCGLGTAPKLGVAIKNDPVLTCLGTNAMSCTSATATLKDDLFPTTFEIMKNGNSCNFKLSYPVDSTLSDVTGKKLAGQYISCPLSIVKTIDNTNPSATKFTTPSTTDLGKYASDIYLYGTLGLFVENNLNQTKIMASGCNGDYIMSVISSYNSSQKK